MSSTTQGGRNHYRAASFLKELGKYPSWARDAKLHMMKFKVWNIIIGKEKDPLVLWKEKDAKAQLVTPYVKKQPTAEEIKAKEK